ncbi:MAG TPA: phosphoribosyl-AMP cyclohydrolase [Nitrospirae bacterium]|nr:phosphoribosyl-AMP cyclohydrolase [Nitrospirota bacterium]
MDKKNIEEGSALNIDFEKRGGLIPAVVQDMRNGLILMLAYVNQEALAETLESGMATFWSTSRNELWTKGKTSGDYLKIKKIFVDCDQDALVYVVEPQGKGACHTKDPESGDSRLSCFYRLVDMESKKQLAHIKDIDKSGS